MSESKAQEKVITGGQMAALLAGVAIEMPRTGNLEQVKAMIAKTKRMKPILRQLVAREREDEALLAGEEALRAWHSGWPRFWRAFKFSYDHEALLLPEYRAGFGWSIVTPPAGAFSPSQLLHEVCERMFPIWQAYDDEELDKVISVKEPPHTHVVLVRVRIEADEEHKDKSARMIETEKISTITLRQRLVLESRYFYETGQHLDLSSVTICAGSRYADGGVPRADLSVFEFSVGSVPPLDGRCGWRVRETVS